VRPFTSSELHPTPSPRVISYNNNKLIIVNPTAFKADPDEIATAAAALQAKEWAQVIPLTPPSLPPSLSLFLYLSFSLSLLVKLHSSILLALFFTGLQNTLTQNSATSAIPLSHSLTVSHTTLPPYHHTTIPPYHPTTTTPPQVFRFDHILWSHDPADQSRYASQAAVHATIGVDMVQRLLNGMSACCFAYGHTGAGTQLAVALVVRTFDY
jgi:hypothetical protein